MFKMPSLKPDASLPATTIPPLSLGGVQEHSRALSGLATYLALPGEQDGAVLQGAGAHFLPALPYQLLIRAGKSVALHFLRERTAKGSGAVSGERASLAALGVTGGPDPDSPSKIHLLGSTEERSFGSRFLARSSHSHLWNGFAFFFF